MKLSIVIPALNEEEGIANVIQQVPTETLEKMGHTVEIIVVDNASTDDTAKIAHVNGATVIHQPLRGYGNAYKAGFANATGDIIITGDADLTYPLDAVPGILPKILDEGYDFINTNRFQDLNPEAMNPKNIFGNKILSLTTQLLFKWPFVDSQSGMWVFKRSILSSLDLRSAGMPFSQELKVEAYVNGFRCAEVPIEYRVRAGKVKLNAVRDGIQNIYQLFHKRFIEGKKYVSVKPKKIALVYDAIFPFIKGGAERRFYELGKRLVKNGNDVHLYGMKLWEGPKVIQMEGMTLHGICPRIPLYTSSGRRSIFQALIFGLSCFKLMFERFDVIDCCGFPYISLFSCRIVSWLHGKPLYSTWHEVWGLEYWKEYLGALGYIALVIEKICVQLPNVIVAVSKHTANDLKMKLGVTKSIVTIHNGLDLENILSNSPATIGADIIFAGRLLEHKNVDVLLQAINILVKRNRRPSAFILGDGPEKKDLEKLTKKLGIGKNVTFLGFLDDHNEMYQIMKASKVFVLPSTREGFGMAALEANACGLPVITINHQQNAAKELIVNGENGTLTELDALELADAIQESLTLKKDRSIYKKYAEKYNWDQLVLKLQRVYLL